VVIRQRKAYPVYDSEYRQHLQVIQDYLKTFENLQTVGRNGMHRYNNQDHSMLTAMLSVQNIMGEQHDLWEVNVERSYHEEFVADKSPAKSETSSAK
jgi:protoporphyrinogen oxidase